MIDIEITQLTFIEVKKPDGSNNTYFVLDAGTFLGTKQQLHTETDYRTFLEYLLNQGYNVLEISEWAKRIEEEYPDLKN